ncbi:hypothetical protein CCYA_CCYA06G1752 [Cyanidiococcus yangmingshanensis]|nr:hypothetical protein CCYA_CCYA06G1752 [Cyanidiococcus yangmingshanensis]
MSGNAEQSKIAFAALLAVLLYRLQDERCRLRREKQANRDFRDGSGEMFELVAPRYDLLNTIISFGLHKRWKRKAVDLALRPILSTAPDDLQLEVLDLATGTADLAIDIAQRYGAYVRHVVAVDPSTRMLENARRKVMDAKVSEKVRLYTGVAEELPSEWSDRFDVCMIGFGVRNFADRMKALSEVYRVLKKRKPIGDVKSREGGRLVILELIEPRNRNLAAPFGRFFLRTCVPLLGALFSLRLREYSYLQKSAREFPPIDEFTQRMQMECGLETTHVKQLGPFGLGPTLLVAKPEVKLQSLEKPGSSGTDTLSTNDSEPKSEIEQSCDAGRSSSDDPQRVINISQNA